MAVNSRRAPGSAGLKSVLPRNGDMVDVSDWGPALEPVATLYRHLNARELLRSDARFAIPCCTRSSKLRATGRFSDVRLVAPAFVIATTTRAGVAGGD